MDTFAWIMVMCDADMEGFRKQSFTLQDAINDYILFLLVEEEQRGQATLARRQTNADIPPEPNRGAEGA